MMVGYLPIYLCLLQFLSSVVLQFSLYKPFISPVKFIPRYFIDFDAIINETIFQIVVCV